MNKTLLVVSILVSSLCSPSLAQEARKPMTDAEIKNAARESTSGPDMRLVGLKKFYLDIFYYQLDKPKITPINETHRQQGDLIPRLKALFESRGLEPVLLDGNKEYDLTMPMLSVSVGGFRQKESKKEFIMSSMALTEHAKLLRAPDRTELVTTYQSDIEETLELNDGMYESLREKILEQADKFANSWAAANMAAAKDSHAKK